MTAIKGIVSEEDEPDGCGVCPVCVLGALVRDMQDVLSRLQAGKEKEATALLCAAIADTESYLANEPWIDEDESLDEYDLGNAVAAGRA